MAKYDSDGNQIWEKELDYSYIGGVRAFSDRVFIFKGGTIYVYNASTFDLINKGSTPGFSCTAGCSNYIIPGSKDKILIFKKRGDDLLHLGIADLDGNLQEDKGYAFSAGMSFPTTYNQYPDRLPFKHHVQGGSGGLHYQPWTLFSWSQYTFMIFHFDRV